MSRVVYTNEPPIGTAKLISPEWIVRNLLRNRELIVAYAKREFQATHRGTYLGLAWTILAPLIMLALFTFVFGHIFNGRFTKSVDETPAEFALALFVGLSFFQCIGQSMGSGCSLVVANATYVKTLAFPLEILSVSAVINVLFNLGIALGLCLLASIAVYGHVNPSAIVLVLHVVCIALLSLGTSWLLAALAVFVRDVVAVVGPLTLVLMFTSSVFFPLSAVSSRMRWVLELNPLAVIIDQARGAFMYGIWPNFRMLAVVFVVCLAWATLGHWVFMRAKPAFADVI